MFDGIHIIGSVYREDLYVPLILTILQYSHAHTVTYLGLTKQFMTPSFFESLSSHGLQYRMIPHAVIKSCAAVQDALAAVRESGCTFVWELFAGEHIVTKVAMAGGHVWGQPKDALQYAVLSAQKWIRGHFEPRRPSALSD